MNFLGVLTRCKNEPYIKEFTDYYFSQGVDIIYIIDDHSTEGTYDQIITNEKIIIIKLDKSIPIFEVLDFYYKKIKDSFEWLISVDVDEYITTKKNITCTIREELQSTFADCDCIKIPWVMMACNSILKNPECLLETNVYRWNHNKRHNFSSVQKFRCRYGKIEVKCIFKPKKFTSINDHHPMTSTDLTGNNTMVVNSINKKPALLNAFHIKLRESDIINGYMLCYHYRIVSIEHCINKIKFNDFYTTYTLEEFVKIDCPEIFDQTLKLKSIERKQNFIDIHYKTNIYEL